MSRVQSAAERNERIYRLLVEYLQGADTEPRYAPPFDAADVEALFATSIWGHREIVLTIVMARLINPEYRATVDLYACKPRSIFEKPIRRALREYGVPHRKSGPLNIAKNINKINEDWAAGKDGGDVALRVVKIVNGIEAVSRRELVGFARAFVSRYVQEAQRIRDMEIELPPQRNPLFLAKLCTDLIDDVPDGGATAQMIVGLLMETTRKARGSQLADRSAWLYG